MSWLNLTLKFYSAYMKGQMQYRINFFMDLFTLMLSYITTFIGMWILLTRFNGINGWSFYEVMLLFNLNLFSYGIASFVFWFAMQELAAGIQDGSFDLVLTKPINPLIYLTIKSPTHPFIAHIILSITVFIICFLNLSIHWTLFKIAYLIVILFGAVFIHLAIYIGTGAINFWVIRTNSLVNTFIYGFRGFISYPLSIYSKMIQILLTFVLPYAFVNFYPAQYLLDGKGDTLFHPVLNFGTPVAGIILLFLAYKLWTVALNRYQSSGS